MTSKYYQQFKHTYLAVDCVTFCFTGEDLEIILIKRDFEPGYGEWALPGIFLEPDESLEECTQRIMKRFTGLENVFFEQFHIFSDPKRDPGDRIVTVGFYALIKVDNNVKKKVSEHKAYWYKLSRMPKLMFDHNQIVDRALESLRQKVKQQPVGFELLPKKFTIPQLQKLYEAIYSRSFDKRNFRKKVLSLKVLEQLAEKDKESSKKGAFLYRFDKKKYLALQKKGYNFEI